MNVYDPNRKKLSDELCPKEPVAPEYARREAELTKRRKAGSFIFKMLVILAFLWWCYNVFGGVR